MHVRSAVWPSSLWKVRLKGVKRRKSQTSWRRNRGPSQCQCPPEDLDLLMFGRYLHWSPHMMIFTSYFSSVLDKRRNLVLSFGFSIMALCFDGLALMARMAVMARHTFWLTIELVESSYSLINSFIGANFLPFHEVHCGQCLGCRVKTPEDIRVLYNLNGRKVCTNLLWRVPQVTSCPTPTVRDQEQAYCGLCKNFLIFYRRS